MKYLLFLFIVFFTACESTCESQSITACGYSCSERGRPMKSYSRSEGCQCSDPCNK